MSNALNNRGSKTLSGGKGRHYALIGLTVFGVALFLLAAPLFIVFVVGMVPTIVSFICDRDREKYTAIAVGAGNVAGVIPFLISLGIKGPTLARASETVTDVFSIAVMYGGAGVGWLIVSSLPAIVAVYMNVTTESRIQRLRRHQKTLVEEWGAEVGQADKPADAP